MTVFWKLERGVSCTSRMSEASVCNVVWRYVSVGLLSIPGCPGSRVGTAVCSLCGIRGAVAMIVVSSIAFNVPRFFQFQTFEVVDNNITHHLSVFSRFSHSEESVYSANLSVCLFLHLLFAHLFIIRPRR